MLKLYCVTGYKIHEGDPVINGHQTREMIIEEAKDILPSEAELLQTAIVRLYPLVKNVYRINPVIEAAREFQDTIAALNSDNVEASLTAERRFRSYALEFDMFLDYWESSIPHYNRIDGSQADIAKYKKLFANLTHAAYDNHVEYQLLDLIRNQTAHVQSSVNRISVSLGRNEAYSQRDILLEKCKSGANKKRILAAQSQEIALSPIVKATAGCLQEIHDGLIDFQIDDFVVEEMKYISGFIGYAISKDYLYEPWLLMDEERIPPASYHIKDMKAYGYILGRMEMANAQQ